MALEATTGLARKLYELNENVNKIGDQIVESRKAIIPLDLMLADDAGMIAELKGVLIANRHLIPEENLAVHDALIADDAALLLAATGAYETRKEVLESKIAEDKGIVTDFHNDKKIDDSFTQEDIAQLAIDVGIVINEV